MNPPRACRDFDPPRVSPLPGVAGSARSADGGRYGQVRGRTVAPREDEPGRDGTYLLLIGQQKLPDSAQCVL